MSNEIITLRDHTTGSVARILPEIGFNCYSFEVAEGSGRRELLWSDPGFATGHARPSGSGIPLLFPFAGRIQGTAFTFAGRTYELDPGDPLGNAIHGFVINRPWEVIDQSATQVVGQFQASKVEPQLLRHWPSDFRLRVSYELLGNTLTSEITVENPGSGPLPFWFGTHPYFRLPLGEQGTPADCTVTVPAARYWPLDKMLPTGEVAPVDAARDLRSGKPFADTQLDDVLTDLEFTAGRCVTQITDARSGRRLVMSFGPQFRECVVYNPPHREAICIEPYSGTPNAFQLEAAGRNPGLTVLKPGEVWTARIDISLE